MHVLGKKNPPPPPPHLRKVHRLQPGSEEYKYVLTKVRGPVKESHRRPYHKRPRAPGVIESSPTIQEVVILSGEEEEDQEDKQDDDVSSVQSSDTTAPTVIVKFETWLKSADGGNLADDKTSKQHRAQISKLLKVIDSKEDLASLFNEKVVNENFLEGFAKKEYHPKTTKSYLMSLRHFYSFCLTENLGMDISKEKILSLKEKVARWSTSLRKVCSKRHWEKMEEDFHALISPEQIEEFERSKAARDTICLLGQLSGENSMQISQSRYTLIRDFLLVEISIDNANRAGALANMKLGEFNRVSKHDEENVVLVKDHKTLDTQGSARIVLSSKLHSWMSREVRSKVPGVTDNPRENVFLTWNAEAMVSSQINKAIKSVWKKAGMNGSPSSTLFRKSAVSKVHTTSHSNEAQENLADLMAHNIETARKFYRLQEKSKSSVKASRQLRSVMRGEVQETPVQKKISPTSCSLSASEESVSKPSRSSWTVEMEALIGTVFKDEIDTKAVSLETVKGKIANHPQLNKEDPKRVLDKIRAQWRFRKPPLISTEQPVSPPSEVETLQQRVERSLANESENSSDIIPPTSGSIRGVFSDHDLENIRKQFAEMIKHSFAIGKQNVKEALVKEAWGEDLLKKVSLDTIVNRIKYERRTRVHRASR